ncbi:hypothetical protein DFH06DRAFT_1253883 [Mycena polygramma]|nr:hypothetical protein DFH06DRAFT_1253883 [Mycena polygramma]
MPVASEESEVDIEVEEMQDSSEEEEDLDGNEGNEDDAGEDELEESDNDQQSTGTAPVMPLKIKLKLGVQPEAKPAARRFARVKNEDVESEDSDSDDSQFESYAAGPSSGRHLTARQAVLASAVDPSHVALDTAPVGSSRKKQFTTTEVALRKEETARKRKNMIEKKLEDEKAETINRLLKKQSRPKTKRTTAQAQHQGQSDEDADMEDDDASPTGVGTPTSASTPMFRWVSSSTARRTEADAIPVDGERVDGERTMSISFSVPEAFLPSTERVTVHLSAGAPAPGLCAVEGCGGARKYRAVGKAWGVGACGMGHLKVLEGQL